MPRLNPTNRRLFDLLFLSLLALYAAGCGKPAPPPPTPPTVQVISVTATNLPIFQEWIGTLDGFVDAQIRAQVTGYLLTQNYTEGSEVKAGDLLFQIDPKPFQATLDQAKAKLAQDQAQQKLTEINVNRYTPLAKEQAISQEELDNEVQANLGALAQIKADEAAVENAQINLGYTRVVSPIDGVAGLAQAQIGDLVGQSSGNILTTVSTINPLRVYFQVSEESYLSFWRKLIDTNNTPSDFPLQLILNDGSVYPQPGRFFFADRAVNPNTGTLQVAGLFPNADFMLRPGQYGRVRAQIQMLTNAIVVPARAVTELQGTYQVDLVNETNGIHVQPVTVGQQIGATWVIQTGLKAGDRLVVEGTQKAREGLLVDPQPFPQGTNPAGTNDSAAAKPPQ